MKRVIFAVVLMILLIGFNPFCFFKTAEIRNEVSEKLEFLQYSVTEGNSEKILSECEKFTDYWLSEHNYLGIIVRHELPDQITFSVSKLVPLAKHGEYGELSAEINRCLILMYEILDSEQPVLRNIL